MTAKDGGRDQVGADGAGGAAVATDPPEPCNDPETHASTLRGVGFEAWEGLEILGCFNPSDDAVANTLCEDGVVMSGTFTLVLRVCTGVRWDLHVFDGSRGLDCETSRAAVNGDFTITPADCACFSPGRLPATGCGEPDGGADGDGDGGSEAGA
jgi:hypothetical protein